MADTVTVPASLLEDIFRLIDYLDQRSDRNVHFHKSGYSRQFEHDNDLWQLRIKIKQLQARIMDTYLLTIGEITEDERRDLNEWVACGYSVYDNPYTLYDERGQPMDYINGCRVGLDMVENPSRYFGNGTTEGVSGCRDDDELPWDDDELPWGDDDIPF
jgi:hypothetical protein